MFFFNSWFKNKKLLNKKDVWPFAHSAMGRRIDPLWWTIKLFLIAASAPWLV